ncbi:MAG: hypothetical protein E7653_05225 [Ruminococcaceae bacterium]|nr:hypothetical protein [Oscillospiraceae bacterium]
MATVIVEKQKRPSGALTALLGVLPPSIYLELESLSARGVAVEELRLRGGKRAYVTSRGKNIPLGITVEQWQIDDIVENVCDGSMYAHADTIRKGYVTLDGGIRVGMVGRASVENGRVIGVYDISGLCIRLPHPVSGVGGPVCRLLRDSSLDGGVLVYSPPGEGKTTLLRAVTAALASGDGAFRVSVVDGRGELGAFLGGSELCTDVLSGYPKAEGIEIAARSMNAQLIVCDEIGDEAEVRAIIAAQNCGVPLLASAHASSIEGLLRRTGIAALHRAAVFGAYVGIKRRGAERDYVYSVTRYEEADERFKSSRGLDSCD